MITDETSSLNDQLNNKKENNNEASNLCQTSGTFQYQNANSTTTSNQNNNFLTFVNQIPTNKLLPSDQDTENIKNILKQIEVQKIFDSEAANDYSEKNKVLPACSHNNLLPYLPKSSNFSVANEIPLEASEVELDNEIDFTGKSSFEKNPNMLNQDINKKKRIDNKIANNASSYNSYNKDKINFKNRNHTIHSKNRGFSNNNYNNNNNNRKQYYKNRDKNSEATSQNNSEPNNNNNSNKLVVNKTQNPPGFRWI